MYICIYRNKGMEKKTNNQATRGYSHDGDVSVSSGSRLTTSATGRGAAHGVTADGLINPVKARPPRRGPARRRLHRLVAGVPLLRRRRPAAAGEEGLDGIGRGSSGGASFPGERGEAVHEAGEVDGGGLGLEHRVREEEVDGAGLELVVGTERAAAGLE